MATRIVIAIIAVAFLAVYFTFHEDDRDEAFMETAQKATAQVVRKQERKLGAERREYWITYKYTTRGNTHIANERVEYPDIWQRLREGQAADIYVNREKPGDSRLALVVERRMGK